MNGVKRNRTVLSEWLMHGGPNPRKVPRFWQLVKHEDLRIRGKYHDQSTTTTPTHFLHDLTAPHGRGTPRLHNSIGLAFFALAQPPSLQQQMNSWNPAKNAKNAQIHPSLKIWEFESKETHQLLELTGTTLNKERIFVNPWQPDKIELGSSSINGRERKSRKCDYRRL